MKDTELHWLAGWLEGEGSFGAYGSTGPVGSARLYPNIQASSTDLDVLERAVEIAGFGKIYGPRPVAKPHHKPIYILQFRNSKKVPELIALLRPLMHSRRQEQIDIAIDKVQATRDATKDAPRGNSGPRKKVPSKTKIRLV